MTDNLLSLNAKFSKVDRVYIIYLKLIANAFKEANRFTVSILYQNEVLRLKTFWEHHHQKQILAKELKRYSNTSNHVATKISFKLNFMISGIQ